MSTKDLIRAAGGIVHGDGNIFFTNEAMFMEAAEKMPHKISGRTADEIWLDSGKLRAALADATSRQGSAPENIREGDPFDNPDFEALAREHDVWGRASSAQAAVFWRAGAASVRQGSAITGRSGSDVVQEPARQAEWFERNLRDLADVCHGMTRASLMNAANKVGALARRGGVPGWPTAAPVVAAADDTQALREAFAELEHELAKLHPENLPANHPVSAACYRLRMAIKARSRP